MSNKTLGWITLASVIVNNLGRVPGLGTIDSAIPEPVHTVAMWTGPIGGAMLALRVIRR